MMCCYNTSALRAFYQLADPTPEKINMDPKFVPHIFVAKFVAYLYGFVIGGRQNSTAVCL